MSAKTDSDTDTDFDFEPRPQPFVIAGTWKFLSGVTLAQASTLAQEMKDGGFKETYRDVFVAGNVQPVITFVCYVEPSPHQPHSFIQRMHAEIIKRFVECRLLWQIDGPTEMVKSTRK